MFLVWSGMGRSGFGVRLTRQPPTMSLPLCRSGIGSLHAAIQHDGRGLWPAHGPVAAPGADHARLFTYAGFEPAHTLWAEGKSGGKSCGIKRQTAPARTIRRRSCNTFRKRCAHSGASSVSGVKRGTTKAYWAPLTSPG